LTLHGAYFGISTGHLLVRDPVTGLFGPAIEGLPRNVYRASGM
jgi:carbonic anhydrase